MEIISPVMTVTITLLAMKKIYTTIELVWRIPFGMMTLNDVNGNPRHVTLIMVSAVLVVLVYIFFLFTLNNIAIYCY